MNSLLTFELSIVVIGTYELSCVQTKICVEIFVDFDGLKNNFLEVRQPNC